MQTVAFMEEIESQDKNTLGVEVPRRCGKHYANLEIRFSNNELNAFALLVYVSLFF